MTHSFGIVALALSVGIAGAVVFARSEAPRDAGDVAASSSPDNGAAGTAPPSGAEPAQAASAQAASAQPAAKDGRAMAALKEMGDTLAKASRISFQADSAVPVASPTRQWVHVFGVSHVVLRRPDRLYVETGGDLFSQSFYFDGKSVTMYAPAEKLYAIEQVQGGLDDTLLKVFEKHGTYFSFTDVVLSVPQEAMAKDLSSAQLVGQSSVGGVACTHLAFAKPGTEWEIWVGAQDHLPRRLDVTYTGVEGRPTGSVTFSDWKLNPEIASDRFDFTPPAGAARIEFKKLESAKVN